MEQTKKKSSSQLKDVWKRLKKNKFAVVSLFIIALLIIIAIIAPLLAPYSYEEQDTSNVLAPSSREHLLGTDRLGRDILSRLLYGSRNSLMMGVFAMVISSVLGIIIGSIAGYFGGKVDNIIMRLLDIQNGIPMMLLCITLAAALGPSLRNAIFAIGITRVPSTARLMRASILPVREMEYVEAARSINANQFRIITKYVIPNTIAPVIVNITMGIGNCILSGASLSFIGLGIQAPAAEWGAMISDARNFMRDHATLALYPGICIMIAVLAFNLLGDGLRDAMDPRLKR